METSPFLFTVASFALVIGVLVFVHEMGHYLIARAFGMRVAAFAVGFGREIVGWTDRRGTRWKIGWIPLGGYARFVGDADASSRPDAAAADLPEAERRDLFQFRPVWQRALVIAAGPGINFLFAVLLFAGLFTIRGQEYTPARVAGVEAGSPAAAAGLRAGDLITAVDGGRVRRFEDVAQAVRLSDGSALALTVERGGAVVEVQARPKLLRGIDRFGGPYTMGRLGIERGPTVIVKRGPVEAIGYGALETAAVTRAGIEGLAQIVTGRRELAEMGGPVKIARVSAAVAQYGPEALVALVALLSINLGFINLLPIPMLDGGHLMLYAAEAVRRRPLGRRATEWAFMSGAALMLTLMLVLTWNDLAQFGVWRQLAALAG